MTTQTIPSTDSAAPKIDTSHLAEPVRATRGPGRKRRSGLIKFLVFIAVIASSLGAAYKIAGREKFMEGVEFVKEQVVGAPQGPPEPPLKLEKPTGPWDHTVTLTKANREAIGCSIIPVLAQTKPITLELPGQTDYDLNTLNKIRPRFDSALVEKVHVQIGQVVKKGDPIIDVRSDELGAAKNDCRSDYVQWDHDHKYLINREPLAKEGKITQIMWTDTQNDEKKSRLGYLMSREKLATYGMTKTQIDKLIEGLGDGKEKALEATNDPQDITRMTMVSPIDGVVVERDAVPGNLYDKANVMITISPMDKLWVWGSVSESDLGKVHIGQKWEVKLKDSDAKSEGEVESIANGLDPETRTLKIRASIPNPDKTLKKGMMVTAYLQIPPKEGDTVIPRNALAVINGEFYAFVEKSGTDDSTMVFERRPLVIEQENTDFVIVKNGLKQGEHIVSNGALILAQIYENRSIVESGLPAQ